MPHTCAHQAFNQRLVAYIMYLCASNCFQERDGHDSIHSIQSKVLSNHPVIYTLHSYHTHIFLNILITHKKCMF